MLETFMWNKNRFYACLFPRLALHVVIARTISFGIAIRLHIGYHGSKHIISIARTTYSSQPNARITIHSTIYNDTLVHPKSVCVHSFTWNVSNILLIFIGKTFFEVGLLLNSKTNKINYSVNAKIICRKLIAASNKQNRNYA